MDNSRMNERAAKILRQTAQSSHQIAMRDLRKDGAERGIRQPIRLLIAPAATPGGRAKPGVAGGAKRGDIEQISPLHDSTL
jgi:hypothetical protein